MYFTNHSTPFRPGQKLVPTSAQVSQIIGPFLPLDKETNTTVPILTMSRHHYPTNSVDRLKLAIYGLEYRVSQSHFIARLGRLPKIFATNWGHMERWTIGFTDTVMEGARQAGSVADVMIRRIWSSGILGALLFLALFPLTFVSSKSLFGTDTVPVEVDDTEEVVQDVQDLVVKREVQERCQDVNAGGIITRTCQDNLSMINQAPEGSIKEVQGHKQNKYRTEDGDKDEQARRHTPPLAPQPKKRTLYVRQSDLLNILRQRPDMLMLQHVRPQYSLWPKRYRRVFFARPQENLVAEDELGL